MKNEFIVEIIESPQMFCSIGASHFLVVSESQVECPLGPYAILDRVLQGLQDPEKGQLDVQGATTIHVAFTTFRHNTTTGFQTAV